MLPSNRIMFEELGIILYYTPLRNVMDVEESVVLVARIF